MTDSGLKTNGKLIYDRWSELRDYGLARLISTPGNTRGLTHEKSEAAGASQSNPPSDGIRSSQGRSQGFVCGQESGGVAVPSCRVCPVFDALGVMFPCLRGSILSRLMSLYSSRAEALGALSSEVPATAGVSTVDPPGSDFELGQKTRPRCRECPLSPTRPLYVRPQSHGPKSGWRRRRTLGTCRAGLRMAAGLWAGARLGLRAS